MMTLSVDEHARVLLSLASAHAEIAARFPGESGGRQPVHTVYGGGHLFAADTAQKLGTLARKALAEHAPDPFTFAKAIDLRGAASLPSSHDDTRRALEAIAEDEAAVAKAHPAMHLAYTVYRRVESKLEREPVEDFRIDFEDGYGTRPDAEEDHHVERAAREVAVGLKNKTLSPFIGVRVKPFSKELAARSARTLDLFLSTLVAETGGPLPENFVVTFPKIQHIDQVTTFVSLLDRIEGRLGLQNGAVPIEIMVEQTQTLLDPAGRAALPLIREAAGRRLFGAHFGTYDYTASCSITAAHQHMAHPACDFAKHMMQVAFAGTGVKLSDGATNVMPVGPHKGDALTRRQIEENHEAVRRAWRLHASQVRRSLEAAFYQGWDLHPAQLPTRYAAVYSFFLESKDAATERLRNFVEKAAQATLVGDVFDDAATGQGLLNFFLRGLSCGALTEEEALATGLTRQELQSKSFVRILENRRGEKRR